MKKILPVVAISRSFAIHNKKSPFLKDFFGSSFGNSVRNDQERWMLTVCDEKFESLRRVNIQSGSPTHLLLLIVNIVQLEVSGSSQLGFKLECNHSILCVRNQWFTMELEICVRGIFGCGTKNPTPGRNCSASLCYVSLFPGCWNR